MSKNLQNVLTEEMLKYAQQQYGTIEKMAEFLEVSVDSISKYLKIHKISHTKNIYKKYYCENIFKSNTEQSFYWSGFIAADGCVRDRNKSKTLKIALAIKDINHLEKFKNTLNATNQIDKYLTNKYPSCVITINDKEIFETLEKFNIVPRKTFIYQMPDWLTTHPLLNHFLRGYFDGDGCIMLGKPKGNRIIKQLSFGMMGTEKLINQYQEILIKNCNLNKTQIKKDTKSNVYRFSYCGNNVCGRIREYLYKDATIYLDRKRDKFYYPTIVVPY